MSGTNIADKALVLLRTLPRICLSNISNPGFKMVNLINCFPLRDTLIDFIRNFRVKSVAVVNTVAINTELETKGRDKGKIT